MLLYCIAVTAIMRKAKAVRPQLGTFGLLLVGFVAAMVMDLLEIAWLLLGSYGYVGGHPSVTLFSGHYYQLPLYEPVLVAGVFVLPFSALLYFRDDKGRSWVERGIDSVKATSRQKTALRFLAVAGFSNIVVFVYNVVFATVTLLPGFTWNADVVQNRSYLRSHVCGEGTAYACPGKDIPVPRIGGAHLDPDGKLIVPSGAEITPPAR
jgi:hypothetical protein